MASPFQTVKSQFDSKATLVAKLLPLLDRMSEESEAAFQDRLSRVSNKKLLTLVNRFDTLKKEHGSREALVDKIVGLKFGEKPNADYRRKLLAKGVGELLDLHRSLARR